MTAVDFEMFVDSLATASGEAILPFFRTAIGIEDKARRAGAQAAFDPVTEADRAAEAIMRRMIQANFPGHGIVGEEFGDIRTEAEYVWVLDPIDGTKGFISGLPMWGTLIGLTRSGAPSYGLMHQPFTRERFRGDGRGAWWGQGPRASTDRRLRTRRCAEFADATLMTTTPAMFSAPERAAYHAIESQARLARYGADCYAYCMLAAGHVDLVIEAGLKPYDIVALVPIIAGAGGVVTDWAGGPPEKGGRIVASGDPALHDKALKTLSAAA